MMNSNTNSVDERLSPAGGSVNLLRRLYAHRSMMAPHQKTRLQGELLLESIKEIERLRDALIRARDNLLFVPTQIKESDADFCARCAEQIDDVISQNVSDQATARRKP